MKNIYVLKEYLLSVLQVKYSGCVCVPIFGVRLIKHILYQLGHQIPSYFFFSVYKCIHLVPVHSRLRRSIKWEVLYGIVSRKVKGNFPFIPFIPWC